MRHFTRVFLLAGLVLMVALTVGAAIPAPGPVIILPEPRLEPNGAGGWKLICPAGCPKKSTTNHHGETNEFCDCNGDGQQDQACKIWLKTTLDGEQTAICHPGCPGEGRPGGQQCSMSTVEKPDGTTYKFCSCL